MGDGSVTARKESWSRESDAEESKSGDGLDQRDKVLSGEFKWMIRSCTSESAVETCSTADSSVSSSSKNSEISTYSDRISSALAIQTLLVETRARDLNKEVYLDPDNDRFLLPCEKVFDNAADKLEMIVVAKLSMSILPQKEVVGTDIQPFENGR